MPLKDTFPFLAARRTDRTSKSHFDTRLQASPVYKKGNEEDDDDKEHILNFRFGVVIDFESE